MMHQFDLLTEQTFKAVSEFNVFKCDGNPYVRLPLLKELNPRFANKKPIKHGASSVMVCGGFTAFGVSPIV